MRLADKQEENHSFVQEAARKQEAARRPQEAAARSHQEKQSKLAERAKDSAKNERLSEFEFREDSAQDFHSAKLIVPSILKPEHRMDQKSEKKSEHRDQKSERHKADGQHRKSEHHHHHRDQKSEHKTEQRSSHSTNSTNNINSSGNTHSSNSIQSSHHKEKHEHRSAEHKHKEHKSSKPEHSSSKSSKLEPSSHSRPSKTDPTKVTHKQEKKGDNGDKVHKGNLKGDHEKVYKGDHEKVHKAHHSEHKHKHSSHSSKHKVPSSSATPTPHRPEPIPPSAHPLPANKPQPTVKDDTKPTVIPAKGPLKRELSSSSIEERSAKREAGGQGLPVKREPGGDQHQPAAGVKQGLGGVQQEVKQEVKPEVGQDQPDGIQQSFSLNAVQKNKSMLRETLQGGQPFRENFPGTSGQNGPLHTQKLSQPNSGSFIFQPQPSSAAEGGVQLQPSGGGGEARLQFQGLKQTRVAATDLTTSGPTTVGPNGGPLSGPLVGSMGASALRDALQRPMLAPRDKGPSMIDVGTMTDSPLSRGPGSRISLEGLILNETEGGLLLVNVMYNGKDYMGTLMDCTTPTNAWASPRHSDIPPPDKRPKKKKVKGESEIELSARASLRSRRSNNQRRAKKAKKRKWQDTEAKARREN